MNARIITIWEDGRTMVWCDFNIEKETPKRRMSFGSVAVFGGIGFLGIGYIAAPRVCTKSRTVPQLYMLPYIDNIFDEKCLFAKTEMHRRTEPQSRPMI